MRRSWFRIPAPPDWLIFFLAFFGISLAVGIGAVMMAFFRMLPYLIVILLIWFLFFRH